MAKKKKKKTAKKKSVSRVAKARKPKKKKSAARKRRAPTKRRAAKRRASGVKAGKKKATTKTKVTIKKEAETPPPQEEKSAQGVAAHLWQAGAHSEEIGELSIPSGKVKVCDAGTLFAPVEVALPPGDYDVRIQRNEDGDNAAAVLIAKSAKPLVWKEIGAYGVDAGMSGFFDADVFDRIDKHTFEVSIYDDLICNHLDPAEEEGHAGAFVPFEEAKFSACRSGYGDGVYAVFEGRDASGTVVAVVTTFM